MLAIAGLGWSSAADAQETIRRMSDVHAACEEARQDGRRKLYVIEFERFRLRAHNADHGTVDVDTRRNLRAFEGAAEFFPNRLEEIGFVSSPARARELLAVARTIPASLRVGFFLGFDSPSPACVARANITTVRFDLAFLELVNGEGEVVAREDTERLRSWRDDEELDGIPGTGPRARIIGATDLSGVEVSTLTPLRRAEEALGRCFAESRTRGSEREGRLSVRIENAPRRASTELSTLADPQLSTCVEEVLARQASGYQRVEVRFAD